MGGNAVEVILVITISSGIFLLITRTALHCQLAYSIGEDDGLVNAQTDHDFDNRPLLRSFYERGRRRGRTMYQKLQREKDAA